MGSPSRIHQGPERMREPGIGGSSRSWLHEQHDILSPRQADACPLPVAWPTSVGWCLPGPPGLARIIPSLTLRAFMIPVASVRGCPCRESRRWRQAKAGCRERRRHRVSGGQDARSERPATRHGQPRTVASSRDWRGVNRRSAARTRSLSTSSRGGRARCGAPPRRSGRSARCRWSHSPPPPRSACGG